MKTVILSGLKPVTGIVRAGFIGAVIIMALAAASVLASPVVKTLGGGSAKTTFFGPALYPYTNNLWALYHTPMGLAVDESGDNVYVADRDNSAVRMVDVGGGFTYTVITNLSAPVGVVLDGDGDLYVLNRGTANAVSTNGMILEFDPYFDLIGTNATHLVNANAMAMDNFGNLYVTAFTNQLIEIAGTTQTTVATVAITNVLLQGIAVMPNGTIAACDSGRNGIYNINPNTGLVTTNAGFNGKGDGTGVDNHGVLNSRALFFQPMGVAAAGDGSLIVSDFGNDRVKVVTSSGITTNLYGVSSNDWVAKFFPGWADGTVAEPDQAGGVASRCPTGVALSPDGSTVFTSEDFYHLVRQVTGGNFSAMPSPPPGAPVGLTAIVTTNGQQLVTVNLSWDAVQNAGVTNYLVERSTSTNSYTIIGSTTGTTFTDTGLVSGTTYYYVIRSENDGGISPDSTPVSVSTPVPPPPAPNIGWYDFEGNTSTGFFSTMHPVSGGNPFIANNPLLLAVDPTEQGLKTLYITLPPYTNGTPFSTLLNNGVQAPEYENNQLEGSSTVNPLPPLTLSNGAVTIEALNINGTGEASAVSSASFIFEVGAPEIIAVNDNAAQFTISDNTTNVVFYYTLDGSDPTNAPFSQQIIATNGTATLSLNGSTNIFFQIRALGYGPTAGYLMSGIAQQFFSSSSFTPNTISWGFAQGECSSKFIAAAGQTFYAPVTLTMLPGVTLYSLQFDMALSSTGPGLTNAGPVSTSFAFQSFMEEPIPGVTPVVYEYIPPLMYAGLGLGIDPGNLVSFNGDDGFVGLAVTNGNQLAVGWLERAGETNLYNTLKQSLITFSQAHDDTFPDAAVGEPNGVIVGGYGFKVPGGAVNGQQYQITVNQASGTSDGIGAPGGAVNIFSGTLTNASAMGPGSLNGIKIVTVGSIPYLVGNVYPFGWFNAGDFGNSNLQSADLEQVFECAIDGVNGPPSDTDLYDAMDSCGSLGTLDVTPGDPYYGYYVNTGPLSTTDQDAMYSGNFTYVNSMAFGDGQLDVSDIYVTFLRSEFTNSFLWFQRFWTNGVRVASASYAPGIKPGAIQPISSGTNKKLAGYSGLSSASITNTPFVNFTATDYVATAGQTLTIPINASTFGPYPIRMLMLNLSVVPLDGSPGITTPVQFSVNPALNAAFGSSTPLLTTNQGDGNFAAVWLPSTGSAVTSLPGLASAANIGTLTVTIPTNATASSSYAIHFDHASASPSGLLSFPNRKFTGLITLSSRTNSYYNDGIPDSWRLKYFGTIYNGLSVSNADADGTGMNNGQKYNAGLNPVDSTSVFNEGFDPAVAQSPQDKVLYWPSVVGQTYIIQRSATLFPPQWTAISTNIGDGTYMEIHDSAGSNNGYYQVTTQ